MSMPILDMRDLSIRSASRPRSAPIVDAVSLRLERGSVVGLIGESGAGKSTIGLAAVGYVRPGTVVEDGSVTFDGIDLFGLPEAERRILRGTRIAYVAQSAAASFNPACRLIDQMIESTLLEGRVGKADAVDRALSLLEILGLDARAIATRYPHEVSGGQLQRAMIAMALCTEPDLIVFDEPTTALDVTTQREVLKAIRKAVALNPSAAIYISHDFALVTQIADTVHVLRHGSTVETNRVDEVVRRPAAPYTRALVAADRLDLVPPPSDGETVLELCDVTARYGHGRPVVSNIELVVRRGETLALVGQSGSGKSTIGRVVNGLLPPVSGGIVFDGRPLAASIHDRPLTDRRAIQTIHQTPDTSLNPRHRISEIIGRPLTLYEGLRGQARTVRVLEALEQVELSPEIARRYPSELSGGQKQRVAIARALAARPRVLVCDEPTSALDALVARDIIALLMRRQAIEQVACLFITHDLNIVRSIANRTMILRSGTVTRIGDTHEVLSPPFDTHTTDLIDSSALGAAQ